MNPEFGTDLALRLHKAEHALDRAIAEVHDLASAMTRGRMKHRLSAAIGQEALVEVAGLGAELSVTRARIVAAHRLMKQEATDLGIPWQAAGPELKPEEDHPPRPAGVLKAVA
jgi:hypothetical protein